MFFSKIKPYSHF